MNPLIIYQSPPVNELTVTGAADGYPLAMALDWREYTWWESADSAPQTILWSPASPVTVSDLLIHKHNLIGASITLEGSDDGFIADITTVVPSTLVTSDRVIYHRFPDITKNSWRITITGQSVAVKISILSLGQALLLDRPIFSDYTPLKESARTEVAMSKRGAQLGAVISHISTLARIDIQYLSDQWYRDIFTPVWDSWLGALKPFFWVHNLDFAPNDIFLMRMKSSDFSAPYHISGKRRFTLDMTGIK